MSVFQRTIALAALASGALVTGPLLAQGPTVLLQPGMTTADFLSAPGQAPSTTGFSLRFAAVVPSASRWWTLILGAYATPYGSTGPTRRDVNFPTLFVGNVFPLIAEQSTSGWLSIDLPLLLTYGVDGGSTGNSRAYGTDVTVQVALAAHIGKKLLREFGGPLGRLRAYAYADQNLTPNADPFTGIRDRFNPVVHYGITVPIGRGRSAP